MEKRVEFRKISENCKTLNELEKLKVGEEVKIALENDLKMKRKVYDRKIGWMKKKSRNDRDWTEAAKFERNEALWKKFIVSKFPINFYLGYNNYNYLVLFF